MKIRFYGAAQTTTGSMHLVEANGARILLDCGLYQGHRKEAFEKNRNLPVDPRTVNAVVLSHAHIDHSGNVPQLVRNGFHGKVYARQATADLCGVMLRDSCFLQRRDLEYVNKRRRAQGKRLFEPLYEEEDIDRLMACMVPVEMHEPRRIAPGVTLTLFNAGHILGSALVQLDVEENGRRHRILFSGDLGQPNQPILRHFEYPQGADILLIESTYADRVHPSADDVEGRLKSYIDDIVQQRAKLIIPAFSVGRTQQVLYYLNRLLAAGRIRPLPVYIDSPLSQKATKIYERHTEAYNGQTRALLAKGVNRRLRGPRPHPRRGGSAAGARADDQRALRARRPQRPHGLVRPREGWRAPGVRRPRRAREGVEDGRPPPRARLPQRRRARPGPGIRVLVMPVASARGK